MPQRTRVGPTTVCPSRRELAGVAGFATRRRTSKRSTFPHRKRECVDTYMPTSKCHPLSHRRRTRSRIAPADPCPSEHSSDACPATCTRTSKCAPLHTRTCARYRTAPASICCTRRCVSSSSARRAPSRSSNARRTSFSSCSSAATARPRRSQYTSVASTFPHRLASGRAAFTCTNRHSTSAACPRCATACAGACERSTALGPVRK